MSDGAYLGKGDVVTELAAGDDHRRVSCARRAELRQRELAKRFNVSPTPVREALRRLESEGLVGSELHRGSRVAAHRLDEQEENYRILAELEALATRLARREDDRRRTWVRSGLRGGIRHRGENDPEAKELNRRFHFRIYECARSPLLLALMRLLWSTFADGPQLWRPHERSVEEHQLLVRALASGDGARASELTRAHVLGSIELMRSKLSERDPSR